MKARSLIFSIGVALLPAGPAWAATEEHGGGIPLKAILYAFLNLFILLGILAFFLRKPTKDFFASRSALIKKGIDEAQALKEEAQKKYSDYESRLKGIEGEMERLIEELKKDGDLERARIIETAQNQVSSLQETSKRIMGQELTKAKEELKKEAVQLAAELAEELVRKNITADDQRRIVKQYLGKMEELS